MVRSVQKNTFGLYIGPWPVFLRPLDDLRPVPLVSNAHAIQTVLPWGFLVDLRIVCVLFSCFLELWGWLGAEWTSVGQHRHLQHQVSNTELRQWWVCVGQGQQTLRLCPFSEANMDTKASCGERALKATLTHKWLHHQPVNWFSKTLLLSWLASAESESATVGVLMWQIVALLCRGQQLQWRLTQSCENH